MEGHNIKVSELPDWAGLRGKHTRTLMSIASVGTLTRLAPGLIQGSKVQK